LLVTIAALQSGEQLLLGRPGDVTVGNGEAQGPRYLLRGEQDGRAVYLGGAAQVARYLQATVFVLES